jgi:N-acetylmuramoyl-L-alanine amidase
MGSFRTFLIVAGMVIFSTIAIAPVHAEDPGEKGKTDALKIVIDAGHGGKDPGALSATGVMEKTITLSIALKLAQKLRDKSFEVIMTRDDDTFIPLRDRTRIANRARADLFVSIHVNANDDKSYEGVETYILSLSADASSTRVAQRENDAGASASGDLQFIIQDMAVNGKINESSLFASKVQRAIATVLKETDCKYRDSGVHQAYFHVLVGALMPSILIETGFITNLADVRLLQDKDFQDRMVDGIVSGINAYHTAASNALRIPGLQEKKQGKNASG